MPSCCCATRPQTEGTNRFFSRNSKIYVRRFKALGLERVQRLLLQGVQKIGIEGKSILDVGCGVGVLHLTLLRDGASQATGVDMSEGMIGQARKLSNEFGVGARSTYVVGDFVPLSEQIDDADITLLDKVVCCYEDLGALVQASTAKTRLMYAVSHPKNNFFMKIAFKTHIALAKMFRWKFHPFWHDWRTLPDSIESLGFTLSYSASTPLWQVLVFAKTAMAAHLPS